MYKSAICFKRYNRKKVYVTCYGKAPFIKLCRVIHKVNDGVHGAISKTIILQKNKTFKLDLVMNNIKS